MPRLLCWFTGAGPVPHPALDDARAALNEHYPPAPDDGGPPEHRPWHAGNERKEADVKTVMGWIDKIVSKLARRKVDRDEGQR